MTKIKKEKYNLVYTYDAWISSFVAIYDISLKNRIQHWLNQVRNIMRMIQNFWAASQ